MNKYARSLARVSDLRLTAFSADGARVTDLAAAFRIKWGLVQSDLDACALTGFGHQRAILDQTDNLALSCFCIVSQKICGAGFVGNIKPNCCICGFTRT